MKKQYSAGHALRVIRQAETVLGWSRYGIVDFLGLTPEAVRLWRVGTTRTVTDQTTNRLRKIEEKVRAKRARMV